MGFLADPEIFPLILGGVFIVGILSGIYPAVFLSSLKPVMVLKGHYKSGPKGYLFRRFAVITQWSISIILIISTFIVGTQLDYMRNKHLGYNKEHLIYMPLRGGMGYEIATLKEELRKNPKILSVTSSLVQLPGNISDATTIDWEGKNDDKNYLINFSFIDYDFIETFKMKITAGRNFSRKSADEAAGAFIINEEAAKMIGWKDPVGRKINHWGITAPVVGVVKNFHFKPFYNPINPLILMLREEGNRFIFLRIIPQDISSTIDYLNKIWNKFNPEYPFEYHFLDDSFDHQYTSETVMYKIFKYLAFLAVFIACLGLFGLSLYISGQKTKEIGIRKVLGASVKTIVRNMSQEFIKWVLLSNLFAWPVSYFLMNIWLQNFAYKAGQNISVFFISGFLAFIIALITVSFHSIKAARTNPVDSLRCE